MENEGATAKLEEKTYTSSGTFVGKTVFWFGLLSAVVIITLLMSGLYFLYNLMKMGAWIIEKPDTAPQTFLFSIAVYFRGFLQLFALLLGTALGLLGAIFVLARVEAGTSHSDISSPTGFKWVFTSASPGIFISFLGCLIVSAVILTSNRAIGGNTSAGILTSSNSVDMSEKDRERMDEVIRKIRGSN